MRMLPSAKRQLANEAGFTLAEVLVTILMMSLVVMALYSMFDMSLRVFSLGNSTVETNQNARVALDRMEREIRSAWPSDNCADPTPPDGLDFIIGTSGSITIRNCLPDDSTPEDNSDAILTDITYYTEIADDEIVLRRSQASPDLSATESLASLGDTGVPLKFRFCKASGTDCTMNADSDTVLVEITLIARDGDQEQTLITSAGLRNANTPPDPD